MSCESDSEGILSKRAKTKTKIVNEDEVEDHHLNHKSSANRTEPEKLEAEADENSVENDGSEKKRATKRSRESDVESSVTSDEDAMLKKRVRKDSDDECLSKPRKFISAATKKRREAVRSAREKRVALESDSEDDSEQSFLVSRKVSGKVRSESENSVDSSDDSAKTSDDKETNSQKTVYVEKENRKDPNKVDSAQKNDDSSSAYNSDTDGENPSCKKGNSVAAEKNSSASNKESDESGSDKPVACSPKREPPDVKKGLSAEDKENSPSEKNRRPCKKPVNSTEENVKKKTDSTSEEEEEEDNQITSKELRNDKPVQLAKSNKSPTSSSSDDEPVKKTSKAEKEAQASDHDTDSHANSPLKSKKIHMKNLKSMSSSDESSSSDGSVPLKKTKQTESKQRTEGKSGCAEKQSNVKGSDKLSGSDSEDEPLKKAKKSSGIEIKVKSEKQSEVKRFKRKTKASYQVSDVSSESDEPLSKMNVARKTPDKKPSDVKIKVEKESDTSESEKESSSSEKEKSSKLCTKKAEQKCEAKHCLSDSEDSGKENKSKGKGSESKMGKESGEQSKVKHEISSSEDSDAPLKKSHKTDKVESGKVQKKPKPRSASSDSSEKNASKSNKKSDRRTPGKLKIERLKKYLHIAGIRVANYAILWRDCKSIKQKITKLLGLLEERGLKGNPSIEKCKKLREKYEQKREVEELDLSNIIDNEEDAGRGRKTRTRSSAPPPSRSSLLPSVIKKEEEATERKAEFQERFSRIKNVFGSSSSDGD